MDVYNPAPYITPTASSARNSSYQQPTYTTAGTIYNPSSSQPLQPPTRRGRHSKYTNGYGQSALSLLPKSDIAALPLRNDSLDRLPVFHQYSPLQQNYDRAVSPGTSSGEIQYTPSTAMSSSGGPVDDIPSYSFGRETATDTSTNTNTTVAAESDGESDGDFISDPLIGMTVKSLQNLASYPNPNQKRAQKALRRGARPNLHEASREFSSDPHQQYRLNGRPRPRQGPLGHTEWTPFNNRWAARDNNPSMLPRRPPPGLVVRDEATGDYLPLGGGLGSGVPKPLTAGPPGQRQYRPSTFESTFKALGTTAGLQTNGRQHDSQYGSEAEHFAPVDGMSALSTLLQDSTIEPGPVGQRHPSDYQGVIAPPKAGAAASSRPISPFNGLASGLRLGKDMPVEKMGQKAPSWRDVMPEPTLECELGTSELYRPTKEQRALETDMIWNGGSGGFTVIEATPSNEDKVKEATAFEKKYFPFPGKSTSVEETTKMSATEIAAPLLGNVLTTLERYREEDWFQQALAKYDQKGVTERGSKL